MTKRAKRVQIQRIGDVIPDRQPAVWRSWLDGSGDADAGEWTSEHEQYYHALLGDSRQRILEPDEQVALRQLGDARKRMSAMNTRMPQNYRGEESFLINHMPEWYGDIGDQFRREQWKQFSDIPNHWHPSTQMSEVDKQMSNDANVYGKLSRRATQFEGDDFGRGPWRDDYEWNPQDDADYDDEQLSPWERPKLPQTQTPWAWPGANQDGSTNQEGYEAIAGGARNVNQRKTAQSGDELFSGRGSVTDMLNQANEGLSGGKNVDPAKLYKMLQDIGVLDEEGNEVYSGHFTTAGPYHDYAGNKQLHGDPATHMRYLQAYEQFRKLTDQRWPQMSVDADAPNAYAQHVRRATQFAINPETMQLPKQKRPVRMGSVPKQYKERVAGAPGDYGPKTRVAYKKSGKRLGRKKTGGYGVSDLAINRRSDLKPPRSSGSVGFAIDRPGNTDDGAAWIVSRSHPVLQIAMKHGGVVRGNGMNAEFASPDGVVVASSPIMEGDTSESMHDRLLHALADSDHPAATEARKHISDEIDRRNLYKFNPAMQRQFSADDYAASLAARHPEYYGEPGHNAHFTPVLPQSMLGQRG